MARSKLRKKFLEGRSENDQNTYNKQRNKCFSSLSETKKTYYFNQNIKEILDDQKFWKTIKSFFSDKSNNFENISLIENGNLLAYDF